MKAVCAVNLEQDLTQSGRGQRIKESEDKRRREVPNKLMAAEEKGGEGDDE